MDRGWLAVGAGSDANGGGMALEGGDTEGGGGFADDGSNSSRLRHSNRPRVFQPAWKVIQC